MGDDLPGFGGDFLADEEQRRVNHKFIGNGGQIVLIVDFMVKNGGVIDIRLIRLLSGKIYVRL